LKPVSADAIRAARDVLRSAGQRVGNGATMTFTEARAANEIVKARMGALRLAERRSELINKARAMDGGFVFFRSIRDSFQVWPSRISAIVAAELRCDAHALEVALDREVNAYLAGMADTGTLERSLAAPPRGQRKAP
jgi:hypothetical protein